MVVRPIRQNNTSGIYIAISVVIKMLYMLNARFTFLVLVFTLAMGISACSSSERDARAACKSGESDDCDREVQKQGMAAGLHESEHLTEGMTALWWSSGEDYFVAGLHRDNEPEPPQVGIYFGSLSNPAKRTVHWFPGEAPGGEDMIGVRVYKDEKSKSRMYFLSQLQNAGFYFPAFYFFSTDSLMTTKIYSRLNCEQIEDIEIATSGLSVRCRIPTFGDDAAEAVDYMDSMPDVKAQKAKPKLTAAQKDKVQNSEPSDDASAVDVAELSMDVDPTVTTLTAYKDEQHRDWLSGVLRSCVQIKGQPNLCYPRN